jgi:vacuolar-type H+-ATPase subunit I/STV1
MLPSSSRDSACGSHFPIIGASIVRRTGTRGVVMAVRNLTERVEVLEMEVGSLKELPARMSAVELQIVELRAEMRGEFSAVRQEMGQLRTTLRQEMRTLNEETRAEMRTLNEETRTQLLTLHEEVLDRIARIGEGRPAGRKQKR